MPAYWTANLQAASTTFAPVAGGPVLTGYATSNTDVYGFKTDGSFILKIGQNGDSLLAGSQADLDGGPSFSFEFSSNPSNMTYKNINEFSTLGGFENPNTNGWIQSENTVTNEYVSWGYWQVDTAGTPKPILNFWVAGTNPTQSPPGSGTTYTYTGKSIGYVYDNSSNSYIGIDAVNNNVVSLTFDFGSGLDSSSYIQFQTNAATPEVWKLDNLSGGLDGSVFVGSTTDVLIDGQTSLNNPTANIKGQFYGNNAEALGGSFKAIVGDKTAIGVFKAVK